MLHHAVLSLFLYFFLFPSCAFLTALVGTARRTRSYLRRIGRGQRADGRALYVLGEVRESR